MTKYVTKQGDMFDNIASEQLGDVAFTGSLMEANPEHINTYVFPAGVTLNIPDVDYTELDEDIPPWKVVLK
ncbi:MAG: tail protein X [Acutalibacteraceae bacterium]